MTNNTLKASLIGLSLWFTTTANHLQAAPSCDVKVLSTSAVKHDDHSTSIFVRVYVKRPVADLIKAVDPQSWATCHPTFKDTYVVNPGTYDPAPAPPAPGSNWNEDMFERIEMSFLNLDFVTTENVLAIEGTDLSGDISKIAYQWNYYLRESVQTRIGPLTFAGGLSYDEGYIRIQNIAGDEWFIDGVKRMKFDLSDPFLTYLLNEGAGISGQLLLKSMGQIACCQLDR